MQINAGQHTEEVKSSHHMPQRVPALKAAQGEAAPPPQRSACTSASFYLGSWQTPLKEKSVEL